MLDLFTAGMTTEERCEDLRTKIRETYIQQKLCTKKTKIRLFYGDINDVGNNVLIVSDPPESKLFESADDKRLFGILQEYGMKKFFLTYYYLLPFRSLNRNDIKQFGYWITQIADIIDPKLIVCLGEDSQFSFMKRKAIMKDYHGQQIGEHNYAPIYTTFPMAYYNDRSEFEDHTYKDYIRKHDWEAISNKYKEVIK